MNIFLHYQKKIFTSLKKLEKKRIIQIPKKFKGLTVELPPQNEDAAISCNVALLLAKYNKISSIALAKILKGHLLSFFKEFKNIEVAGPGFLNIYFDNSFWKKHLLRVIELNSKYGSRKADKKKYDLDAAKSDMTGRIICLSRVLIL